MASGQGPRKALTGPGLLLLLLLLLGPAGAWYKHVASPRYHTVGRASGLLMGVRRSPYLWRREEADHEASNGPPADALPRWLRLQLQLQPLAGMEAPRPQGPWGGGDGSVLERLSVRPPVPRPSSRRARGVAPFLPGCLASEELWPGMALERALRKEAPSDGEEEEATEEHEAPPGSISESEI